MPVRFVQLRVLFVFVRGLAAVPRRRPLSVHSLCVVCVAFCIVANEGWWHLRGLFHL